MAEKKEKLEERTNEEHLEMMRAKAEKELGRPMRPNPESTTEEKSSDREADGLKEGWWRYFVPAGSVDPVMHEKTSNREYEIWENPATGQWSKFYPDGTSETLSHPKGVPLNWEDAK